MKHSFRQIGNIIDTNANNSTDDLTGLLHSYEFFQISSLRKPEVEFNCHLFRMFWPIAVSHAFQTRSLQHLCVNNKSHLDVSIEEWVRTNRGEQHAVPHH